MQRPEAPSPLFLTFLARRLNGLGTVVEQGNEHQRIADADDAKPVERGVPGQTGGYRGPEAADGLTHIEAGHVDAYG